MRSRLLAVCLCAALSACAQVQGPPPPPPPPAGPHGPPPTFHPQAFDWSAQRGSASIRGETAYGHGFSCAGQPVVLTPDTPYSRWRIVELYGSADHAALPVAEVRSRQAHRPSDEYSAYVRRTTCDPQGHFDFEGLPAGGWFVIAVTLPGGQGGQAMALMRRVQTRAGAVRSVVLD